MDGERGNQHLNGRKGHQGRHLAISRTAAGAVLAALLAAIAALPAWADSGAGLVGATDPSAAPAVGTPIASIEEEALKPSDPEAEVGIEGNGSSVAGEPPALTGEPDLVLGGQAQAETTSEYLRAERAETPSGFRALTDSIDSASLLNPLIRAGIAGGGGTTGLAPADATGAVGVTYYLEAVDSRIAVYDQTDLHEVTSKGLAGFIGAPGDVVTEPQLLRDDVHGRWYYAARRLAGNGDVFLAFGWSKDGSPTNLDDGWCNFFVRTDDPNDFPRLGQDTNRLVMTSNSYDAQDGLPVTAKIRAIPKPGDNQTSCDRPSIDTYGTRDNRLRDPDGDLVFTPVPALTLNDRPTDYIVSADYYNTRDQLNLWSLSGPKSAPVLSALPSIAVTRYESPPYVPQPGTGLDLWALDTRLTQAVAQGDPTDGGLQAIWTQHTVRDVGGGLAEVRWYEITPGGQVRLRQAGSISSPSLHVFNGAIAPTRQGNGAIIHYDTGNDSTLATLKASSRGPTTPLSQMDSTIVLRRSDDPLTDNISCGSVLCRWGDYASSSTDMYEDNTVWGSSELAGPHGTRPQWITENFALDR